MPWEYRLLIAHPDERDPKGYCHEVSEMLNRSGQEGWEVVGVHKDVFWGVEWPVYTLKRFVETSPSHRGFPPPPTAPPPPPPPPPASYPPPAG